MFKKISMSLVLLLLTTGPLLSQAGLDIEDTWGDIVALYSFNDSLDSGPRGLHGNFYEGADSVRGRGKQKCLRLEGEGSFGSFFNERPLALPDSFSIVAFVKLHPQKHDLNIGMHGLSANGDSLGYANIRVKPDGNLSGVFRKEETDRTLAQTLEIRTEGKNISDNRWHHIAFTGFSDVYTLFIDGEIVARRFVKDCVCFGSDRTNIYITNSRHGVDFVKKVFVDEVVFFQIGLSLYEIRAIRKVGYKRFLNAMAVESSSKVTTTWGKIKSK